MCSNSSTGCDWAFQHKQLGLRSNVALGVIIPSLCKYGLIYAYVQLQLKWKHFGFLCMNSVKWARMWFQVLLCVVCVESDLTAISAIMVQIDAIGLFCINSMECSQWGFPCLYAQLVQIWLNIAKCALLVQMDAFGLFVHEQREMSSNVILGFITRSLCKK